MMICLEGQILVGILIGASLSLSLLVYDRIRYFRLRRDPGRPRSPVKDGREWLLRCALRALLRLCVIARYAKAFAGVAVMMALPFGGTAARFYLWCKHRGE